MANEHVHIVINGTPLQVPAGEMIIESARRIGVEIPHFCYHPRLSMEAGANCRMCLVEVSSPRRNPDGSVSVAKMPKPQTSCSLPASEGMEIETETPAIVEARRGVLEFLLINHPLDCPICDRGGECPLQNNTLRYGPPTTRYAEQKRHVPKAYPLSEHVVLDRERCIHCARCTRFADDIAGDAQLGFLKRGADMEVSTRTGLRFTSLFSGNTVELCPVGALLARNYRFGARPWDLHTQQSICTECSNGCNLKLDHRAGRFVRVNARLNEDVNEEWTCDRGKFGMGYLSGPDLLEGPLVRDGDRFVQVGWPEALDAVAGRLKAAGPNAVFVGGTRASNEDLFVVQRLFREVLGSGNLDHRRGPAFGPGLDLCRERVPEPLSALERRPAFVAFGLDAAWEQPMAYLRVRKAWKRGRCRIVSVAGDGAEEDGRSASLGALAVARLRHRPGAEAYAAWLLARAVVAALGGSTEVSASVEERLAGPIAEPGAIGLDPVALDAAARALASCAVAPGASEESPGPAVWAGASVRGTNELDTLVALDVLASVLHGRERKASLPALEANEQGARDMGILPDVGPGGVPAAHQGWDGEQSAGAILRGEPVGLWVSGADLAATGNGVPWRDALAKCPFVVYTGAAMDETARMADVVLPVTTVAERNGTFTSAMGRVQRFLQAYEPARNARDEWWVAAQISARIGFRMDYAGAAGVLADLSRAVPGYAGCTWDELGDGGVDRTVPGAGESV